MRTTPTAECGTITNPRLLYAKGAMFLVGGVLASLALFLEHPTLKVGLLLAIAVWCFARAYYFAFYVVQHYVDDAYRFAGLISFARYLVSRRHAGVERKQGDEPGAVVDTGGPAHTRRRHPDGAIATEGSRS